MYKKIKFVLPFKLNKPKKEKEEDQKNKKGIIKNNLIQINNL